MATPIKTMRDSNGQEVPVKYVSAYDKLRDKITRRIKARFLKARAALEAVVSESIADLDELAKCKESVGAKGNFPDPHTGGDCRCVWVGNFKPNTCRHQDRQARGQHHQWPLPDFPRSRGKIH